MRDLIQPFVVFVFILACLAIGVYSIGGDWSGSSDRERESKNANRKQLSNSSFVNVNYYIYKNQKDLLHLDADKLDISGDGQNKMINPNGEFYLKDGSLVEYQAEDGIIFRKKNLFILKNNVQIESDDSTLFSDQVEYLSAKGTVTSVGSVKTKTRSKRTGDKIFIDSDKMVSWPEIKKANYYGNVKGRIERKKVYEQPVFFDSDKLYMNSSESKVELKGNVFLKKQTSTASSRRGEIFLENYNKKLRYYVLYDDVKVMEKLTVSGGKTINRRAYAEKLEGFISEDKVILTGYPKVFQNNDVIKGNRIVLRDNNEIIEVDDASTNFMLK